MQRYEYAEALPPRRVSYERRPATPDAPHMVITVSTLAGLATAVGAAGGVMLLQAERRWLWIAVLLGAAAFLFVLIWRLQVQDAQSVIERETTIDAPGPTLRPTVTDSARGNVIRRGNFAMERKYWQRLFDLAQDGRRLTRDEVQANEAMPRELYYGRFAETTAEMQRLGLLDEQNRATDEWRKFHREMVETAAVRPSVRTVASRNGTEARGVGGIG